MIPVGTASNITEDRYLSAMSGSTTTIVLPLNSSCSAIRIAAAAAAPVTVNNLDLLARQHFNSNKPSTDYANWATTPAKQTARLQAIIIFKECGDKLQVLTIYKWKQINPGASYCIITNDQVVYALCLQLEIPVFLVALKTGFASLTIYNPETVQEQLTNTVIRWGETKNAILKSNLKFIDN